MCEEAVMGWWIAHADRTITEHVSAEPAAVRDLYADLDHIAELHPLVVSVKRTARSESVDAKVDDYRVTDRIPLGPLHLRISYRARVEVSVEGVVRAHARQFPRIRLDSEVTLDPSGTGTLVTERLRISAPRPLAAATFAKGIAAHIDTWAAVRRRFSG